MSHRNQDKFGAVLLQVRDDLRQLRGNLEKIRLSDRTTLDIQALDDAIRKTENSIKKHAEDYLKTVSEQLLVLPNIEDIHKKAEQIPKWKPDLDSFPALPPQREVLPGASQREKGYYVPEKWDITSRCPKEEHTCGLKRDHARQNPNFQNTA